MREIDSVCNSNFSNNIVFLKRGLDANVEKGSLKCEWIRKFLSVPSNIVIPNPMHQEGMGRIDKRGKGELFLRE